MSESEDFLSRWSRLKRESGTNQPGVAEQPTRDELPDGTAPPGSHPDPAQLPPIESIVAGSDIRPFLQPGVPAELTRAALRSAWSADPAICDFVGIADNQWDFNAEAAIPGFGSLAAPAPAACDPPPGKDVGAFCESSRAPGNDPQATDCAGRPAGRTSQAAPQRTGQELTSPPQSVESSLEQDALEDNSDPPKRRSHGGALPA